MTSKDSEIKNCPKCGKEPERDKEMFNENWAVIPAECPTCKLRLKLEIKEVKR